MTHLKDLKPGTKVKVYIDDTFPMKSEKGGVTAEDIVAGVPQLIKDGKIDITWEKEGSSKSFVETRHPRTAVAKLKDGKFLMITIDGRSEISGGIGLQDLAEYLLSLGAIDAMNLDGGGSTTMFVGGKVVNRPSDKEGERKVSDALLVTPRR
jgi:exopolysaccharide biosynthesis protein